MIRLRRHSISLGLQDGHGKTHGLLLSRQRADRCFGYCYIAYLTLLYDFSAWRSAIWWACAANELPKWNYVLSFWTVV